MEIPPMALPENGKHQREINSKKDEEKVIIHNDVEVSHTPPIWSHRLMEYALDVACATHQLAHKPQGPTGGDWPPQTGTTVQTDRDRVEARQQREAAQIERDKFDQSAQGGDGYAPGTRRENHRECNGGKCAIETGVGQARAIERGELAEKMLRGETASNALAEMGDEMEVGSDYVRQRHRPRQATTIVTSVQSWFLIGHH